MRFAKNVCAQHVKMAPRKYFASNRSFNCMNICVSNNFVFWTVKIILI